MTNKQAHPAKFKNQNALFIKREDGESSSAFVDRILADPRLMPDQRVTLEHDRRYPTPFDDLVAGFWMDQPPIRIA